MFITCSGLLLITLIAHYLFYSFFNDFNSNLFVLQLKPKNDANLLSPVPEAKQNEGDKPDKEEAKEDKTEGEKESKADGKSIDQHSVTIAEEEGIEGAKRAENNTESSTSNQHLNEYTFSPAALHAAISHEGESANRESAHSLTDKM